jgi:hypothetical protein
LVQPAECALDEPAKLPQAVFIVSALGDARFDSHPEQ